MSIKKIVVSITIVIFSLIGVFVWLITNPIMAVERNAEIEDVEMSQAMHHLRSDVEFLTSLNPSRSASNINSLDKAANYIRDQFTETGCEIKVEEFAVDEDTFQNITCSFGVEHTERMVIGAHYDVHYEENPGADDNASGVAGILEVARMLSVGESPVNHRIDLIAFSLEELPHFRSGSMGSTVQAGKSRDRGEDIKLMISVEMIGYFSNKEGSQKFPHPALGLLYPTTGNFIAVIGRLGDRSSVRNVKRLMRQGSPLATYSLNAPRRINGIDFSDHLSYWDAGYDAVMITDTSFLRNPHYHKPTDTIDTLNFKSMAQVVKGIYNTALNYDLNQR